MIEHYDTGSPLSTQWSDFSEQMLYIFINALNENTKIHLAMNNPPENLAEALARAKTYQAVTKTVNPIKSLYPQIREKNIQTSAAILDHNQQAINKKNGTENGPNCKTIKSIKFPSSHITQNCSKCSPKCT